MQAKLDYGRRLTQQEYERAVVDLYDNQPCALSGGDDEYIRQREMNLTIDYRLGVDFPAAKREALWRVQQHSERERMRFAARTLLAPLVVRSGSNALARLVLRGYAQVLTPDELNAYFGY